MSYAVQAANSIQQQDVTNPTLISTQASAYLSRSKISGSSPAHLVKSMNVSSNTANNQLLCPGRLCTENEDVWGILYTTVRENCNFRVDNVPSVARDLDFI